MIGGIKEFPHEEARVGDIVGSLYNFLYGISSLLFPIVGGALVKSVGFRWAIDIISIVLLTNGIIYLISVTREWRKE